MLGDRFDCIFISILESPFLLPLKCFAHFDILLVSSFYLFNNVASFTEITKCERNNILDSSLFVPIRIA